VCSHLSGPFANHQAVALSKIFRVYIWNRFSSTSVASLWPVDKCRAIVYPKLSKSTCYYPIFVPRDFGIGPFPLLMFLCRVSFHLEQISFTFHLLYICSTWLQKPAHDSVEVFLLTFPQWRNFQFCQELDKLGSSPRCSWCSLIHIFRYLPLVDYHCQGLGRCLLYRFHQ